MSDAAAAGFAPATDFIKFDDAGKPYIEGQRCSACQATFTQHTLACPRCGARGTLSAFKASNKGLLYTFTVVKRSYPGVKVPFVSAIVDLSDGITLKGNLRGAGFEPEKIKFGMPVKVVFDDTGLKNDKGEAYISYYFEPAA